MKLSREIRFATITLLLVAPVLAASQTTPPTCAGTTELPTQGIQHTTAAPSIAALEGTAAEATRDSSILPAREPANFGIARYRIEEYADCSAGQGCYWADLDAQTRRAEAELDRLLAQHHASTPAEARRQRLALVLDIDETGDQWSDLLGTSRAELSVKLPNPFYYLP